MLGRQTVKVIRQLLDRAAGVATTTRSVDVLSDAVSSQKTPLRFPSIISKFRSEFYKLTNLYYSSLNVNKIE